MRNIISVLSLLSLVFCAGCGTLLIHSRGTMFETGGVYRGVRLDCEAIAWTPVAILDVPFSGIADTILLPYDLTTVNTEKSQ